MRWLLLVALSFFVATDAWPSQAEAKPRTFLRIATLAPARSPMGREYTKLDRDLRKNTNDEVGIRMYSGGVAGDEKTVVRKIRAGQLDGAMLTAVGLGAVVRKVLVLQAPGLITSYGELDRVRKELGPELEKLFDDAGYTLVAWGDAGRIRVFSTQEVLRPADLRKVRPWVWRDSPTMKAFVRAAGGNGVALGMPEVYSGLQTGMIDTVISSAIGVVAFQWHTKLKMMSKQASGVVVGAFILRKDKLEALSEEAQKYILESARSSESQFRRAGRKLDEDAARALEKRLKVVDMEPYQRSWDATATRAREDLAGRLYPKSLLERVQAIVEAP